MEPLCDADVLKIARLAKLELTADECADARERLTAVLGHIERLRELDLDGIEPMAHAHGEPCRLRDDEPGPTLPADTLESIAPRTVTVADPSGAVGEDGMPAERVFIAVPRVLDGEGGA